MIRREDYPFQYREEEQNNTDNDIFFVALDSEGYSLDTKLDADTPLWCISLAWYEDYDGYITNDESYPMKSVALPWSTDVALMLNDWIEDGRVCFIIHNATYDVPTLRLRGVKLRPGTWVDSLLLAYLMQPDNLRYSSLEKWGERLGIPKLDYRKALIEANLLDDKSPKGDEYKVPFNRIMEQYAKRDTEIALTLWSYLNQQMFFDEELFDAYYRIELPYQEIIIQMEQNGSYIDREMLFQKKEEVIEELNNIIVKIREIVPYAPDCSWGWVEDNNRDEYVAKVVKYSKEYEGVTYVRNLTQLGKVTNAKKRQSDPGKVSDHYKYTWEHCVLNDFEPISTHIAWYLMTYGGWTPTKKQLTKEKKPSTQSDVLEGLKLRSKKAKKLIALCLQHAKLSKLLSTYIIPLLEYSEKDGYVHGNFIQTNTATTRLSSAQPNLQNIDPSVRSAFCAPPGYILAVADLDRIELVVLAHYLQLLFDNRTMTDAIIHKIDLHQANADLWGISRKIAKTVIFLLIYGGGADKLSKTAGCTVEQAEQIIEQVYSQNPDLLEFKKWVIRCAQGINCYEGEHGELFEPKWVWKDIHTQDTVTDGFIRLLGGQRVYVPEIFLDDYGPDKWKRLGAERQLGNYQIQGTAASINKQLHFKAFMEARKHHARPVLVVHDENMFYIPITQATEELRKRLSDCMSSKTLLGDDGGPPITGEYHYGFDWIEAKEGNLCNLKNKDRWIEWETCISGAKSGTVTRSKETGTSPLDKK